MRRAAAGRMALDRTPPCSDLFGAFGLAWLDGLDLPQPYAGKVASLRQQIIQICLSSGGGTIHASQQSAGEENKAMTSYSGSSVTKCDITISRIT
jgi:hypothetical protein